MRLPCCNVRFVVLHDGFQLVHRLVELRLRRLQRDHLAIERLHFPGNRLRQAAHPCHQLRFLARFVRIRLGKCRDVSDEAFAEVMNEAHPDDLIDVHIREFVLHPECHQRDAPAVLRDRLVPPAGRIAVPRLVLQPLRHMQRIQ